MLITGQELKRFIGISDTDSDALLTDIIRGVQAWVENYCGRTFESEALTPANNPELCKLNGDGDRLIILPKYPVTAITKVEYYNSYTEVLIELVDSDYYTISGKLRNFLLHQSGWVKGTQNIWIEYTAGYTEAEIPEDLKLLIKKLCGIVYDRRENSNIKSESVGHTDITYFSAEFPQDILDSLVAYRVINA